MRQSILKKAFEGKLLSEAEIVQCKAAADYEPGGELLKKIQVEKLAKAQKIKNRNMENKINSIAFELFRQWTRHAAIEYPDLAFNIIDESILVKDLEGTLESALISLVKTEKPKKRAMPGYDYGFILGFIQGKLNAQWGFEYITKRSKAFKHLMINKALLEYLRFETLTSIRVKALYEKMYEETVNLESLDFDLPRTSISDFNIDALQESSFSNTEQNPVLVFLENQFSKQLLSPVKTETKNFLPALESFFDREFVMELIRSKENA